MAKDPTFPFYAQDFIVDTIRWTRAMQGLHVSLMAESWANGGIPDDDGKPAGLGSTDVEPWFKIKHKWVLADGMWTSPKLEEVRAGREAFREKQREKGILSGKKRNHSSTTVQPKTNNGSTVVEPIESESEYEGGLEKKIKDAFDERYLDEQGMKWSHVDFPFQFKSFLEKVRGSPGHYATHNASGLRLALQSQLRAAKHKVNVFDKRTTETISRRQAFATRRGTGSGE